MNDRDLLQQLGEETRPTASELDAVRRKLATRLALDGDAAAVSRSLLRHLPAVTGEDLHEARLRHHEARRRRVGWWLPVAGAFGAGVACTLAAGAALLAWETVGPREPAPISGTIVAGPPVRPAPGVTLSADGAGEVRGTTLAPEIAWTGGRLAVEVDPGRGIALSVVTREATVRVVGTVFDVQRDALGTRVEVSRGKVEVTCAAGGVHLLEPGDDVVCLPTTAPGLLARANALSEARAPDAQILEAVDAGLPLATEPFRGELRALRAETLLRAGRAPEALVEARAYLQAGGPRRIEVLELAVSAAMATGGCREARPFLLDLEELGQADPDLLLTCEARP